MRKLLFAFAALFAFGALAQEGTPAVLTPGSPTSLDIITARFRVLDCSERTVTTVVTGSLVQTTVTVDECLIITLPLAEETATFGPLPVGQYTYEIYIRDSPTEPRVLLSRQTFAVTAPPIPALSTMGIAMMIAALTLVAFWSVSAKPPLS